MKKEIILVRGGGDIASGIIQKLFRSGFNVLVLECENPTFIRGKVSYGAAVYCGEVEIENSVSRCIGSLKKTPLTEIKKGIENCFSKKIIPVLIDSEIGILEHIKVLGVVDAILAKKNLGTKKEMASITVGVGPGFTAGKDVDIAIETMRGHNLGKLIFSGSPLKNTGIPGKIGGESSLRVIYSQSSGKIEILKEIGTVVKPGEIICRIDMEEVAAPISGVVRGMITQGFQVDRGMKIADIDPRVEEYANCFTISDKARSIGGGVLEAVMYLKEQLKEKNV